MQADLLQVPNSPDRRFKGVPPKNVFTVNDSYDAAVALHWVENNLLNSSGETRHHESFDSCSLIQWRSLFFADLICSGYGIY